MNVPFADLEYLVLEKIRQEAIEELEGIDLKTPRGRWLLFTFLSAMNDLPNNATRRMRTMTPGTGGTD